MPCADSRPGSWGGSIEVDKRRRRPEALQAAGVEGPGVRGIDELLDELRHAGAPENAMALTFEHQMPRVAQPLHDFLAVLRWSDGIARARENQDGLVAAQRGVEVGGPRGVRPAGALRPALVG